MWDKHERTSVLLGTIMEDKVLKEKLIKNNKLKTKCNDAIIIPTTKNKAKIKLK